MQDAPVKIYHKVCGNNQQINNLRIYYIKILSSLKENKIKKKDEKITEKSCLFLILVCIHSLPHSLPDSFNLVSNSSIIPSDQDSDSLFTLKCKASVP